MLDVKCQKVVQIRKKEGETAGAMLRRFTRRVQQSGVLLEARHRRFYKYPPTKRETRLSALRRIKITGEREKLAKLGKLPKNVKGKNRS